MKEHLESCPQIEELELALNETVIKIDTEKIVKEQRERKIK
jgi:hypothetical protein